MVVDGASLLELPVCAVRMIGAAVRAFAEVAHGREPVAHDGLGGALAGVDPLLPSLIAAGGVGVALATTSGGAVDFTLEVCLEAVELCRMHDHDGLVHVVLFHAFFGLAPVGRRHIVAGTLAISSHVSTRCCRPEFAVVLGSIRELVHKMVAELPLLDVAGDVLVVASRLARVIVARLRGFQNWADFAPVLHRRGDVARLEGCTSAALSTAS